MFLRLKTPYVKEYIYIERVHIYRESIYFI
jgi:hypothetical protein